MKKEHFIEIVREKGLIDEKLNFSRTTVVYFDTLNRVLYNYRDEVAVFKGPLVPGKRKVVYDEKELSKFIDVMFGIIEASKLGFGDMGFFD